MTLTRRRVAIIVSLSNPISIPTSPEHYIQSVLYASERERALNSDASIEHILLLFRACAKSWSDAVQLWSTKFLHTLLDSMVWNGKIVLSLTCGMHQKRHKHSQSVVNFFHIFSLLFAVVTPLIITRRYGGKRNAVKLHSRTTAVEPLSTMLRT